MPQNINLPLIYPFLLFWIDIYFFSLILVTWHCKGIKIVSLSLKSRTHFGHFVLILSWSNISFTRWQKLFWQLAWNNPRGGWNKKGVSQTVILMHGVQIALSTERWKYRDRDTHTHKKHTEDIPQCHCRRWALSSWECTGEASLKRAASARALGSRCENSPTELPHSSVITSF